MNERFLNDSNPGLFGANDDFPEELYAEWFYSLEFSPDYIIN
ncbi:Hypothetical protein LUCI_5171 [Lucifera butyrica]|uniref:Uncharacterized protein n=1 Tax=Lucifera butyrica TaxID=1351585 RepID=A0A498RIF0_9FIRM|nr:hypothetical protein [Lucifera butyrica]VBB09873.1 Hypothetical protein LUCI_5171 [Lucifera butyrica]